MNQVAQAEVVNSINDFAALEDPQYYKKVGRPTKYKKEYCELMLRYFDIDPNFESPVTLSFKGGMTIDKSEIRARNLPLLSRFARRVLGVNESTLFDWAQLHPEFRDTLDKCKQVQKEFLIENGLHGTWNANFAKFVATNITDMREKTEVEHSGNLNLRALLDETDRITDGTKAIGQVESKSSS